MKVYAVMIFSDNAEARLDRIYEKPEDADVRVNRLRARGFDARRLKKTLIEEYEDYSDMNLNALIERAVALIK